MAALELRQTHLPKFQRGAYVYVVMRWSVSGSREIERLEYMARSLDRDRLLDGDQAEQLVNIAALTFCLRACSRLARSSRLQRAPNATET